MGRRQSAQRGTKGKSGEMLVRDGEHWIREEGKEKAPMHLRASGPRERETGSGLISFGILPLPVPGIAAHVAEGSGGGPSEHVARLVGIGPEFRQVAVAALTADVAVFCLREPFCGVAGILMTD